MAIYDIKDFIDVKEHKRLLTQIQKGVKKGEGPDPSEEALPEQSLSRKFFRLMGKTFSFLFTRVIFLLLLCLDLFWGAGMVLMSVCGGFLALVTLFQVRLPLRMVQKGILGMRRSLIGVLSLSIGFFSPSLGIMFGCLYFLLYDKKGIDEMIPTSLREQFKELFPLDEDR